MPRKSGKSIPLFEEICHRMAEGRSLESVCRDKDMPPSRTVWDWMKKDENLRSMYDNARDRRGQYFGELIADVAKDALTGQVDPNAARVAMDGFKWAAARMSPKQYGDRIHQDIKVDSDAENHLDAVRNMLNDTDNVIPIKGKANAKNG
ncbi:MAG: putative terminase small subunit [Prokaryotic dsDNA virus sp.]|nr:MAG: putative terminase small subunit [Prokaryotic dsDNA virus sp.]|tara:strand:- start:137 stop:583 length:447 start_codon:yes stop_codon:yes gene_type:complete